jgi:hypothetical protein
LTHGGELVAHAVQASCAIPLFFQPIERRFVDGGLLSNLPAFVFSERGHSDRPLSTRVLAFSLESEESAPATWDTLHFLRLLVNTIIDGGQKLQLDQQRSIHVIKIPTGDIKATDFERMTPELTQKLIHKGTESTQAFFDEELQRVRDTYRSPSSICFGMEEVYTHVAGGLDIPLTRVVISQSDTDWAYSLFPSLLCWRMRGVRIQVLLPEHGDHPKHGPYRRKLLRALGVEVTELQGQSSVPIGAYVLDTTDTAHIKAIVSVERGLGAHGIAAVLYDSYLDAPAIRSLLLLLDQHIHSYPSAAASPSILPGMQDKLMQHLGIVGQYGKPGIELTVESVPISNLISLTRFVREYKYKQIHHLIRLYSQREIALFAPAAVAFADGRNSILTPPVVEESGGNFVLIEGSTRATYCRDFGAPKVIKCVVVRGVRDPLPSEPIPFKQVRVVGRTLKPSQRCEGFDYSHFRSIENNVHPPESLG